MQEVYLSVVIPSYNEMANLQKGVLEKVKAFLDTKNCKYEVIVVDDGSVDDSIEFVEKFITKHPEFRLIKNTHLGKGGAVTTGVLKARGEFILFTDMDQATPIEEIDRLMPFFKEKYAIVIGSRNRTRKGSPWFRLLMSRTYMTVRGMIVNLGGISDTQCGFKMFRHEAAQKIFTKIYDLHNGFHQVSGSSVSAGFDVELLYIALKMGYTIKEVPVRWLHVETKRINPVQDSLEALSYLFTIRANDKQGKYSV